VRRGIVVDANAACDEGGSTPWRKSFEEHPQMKTNSPLSILLLLSALANPMAASAQDAAVANPDTVHVKLDNTHVRALEAVLKPGQKENLHSHPASVIYVISGGKVRNHTADGRAVESELVDGQTVYRDPITHWVENIGTTTIHLILVEIKDQN
jgi:quercetin dioxygenase-like cupin family protein